LGFFNYARCSDQGWIGLVCQILNGFLSTQFTWLLLLTSLANLAKPIKLWPVHSLRDQLAVYQMDRTEKRVQIRTQTGTRIQTAAAIAIAIAIAVTLLPRQIISVINDSLRWQLEAKWRHRQMALVVT